MVCLSADGGGRATARRAAQMTPHSVAANPVDDPAGSLLLAMVLFAFVFPAVVLCILMQTATPRKKADGRETARRGPGDALEIAARSLDLPRYRELVSAGIPIEPEHIIQTLTSLGARCCVSGDRLASSQTVAVLPQIVRIWAAERCDFNAAPDGLIMRLACSLGAVSPSIVPRMIAGGGTVTDACLVCFACTLDDTAPGSNNHNRMLLDCLLQHGASLDRRAAVYDRAGSLGGSAGRRGGDGCSRGARGTAGDVDARAGRGTVVTALHAAAAEGNAGAVRLLLERGADSTIVDNLGNVPLHACASAANLDELAEPARLLVAAMCAAGSDPSMRNEAGQSPTDVARKAHVDGSSAALLRLLEALGAGASAGDRGRNEIGKSELPSTSTLDDLD